MFNYPEFNGESNLGGLEHDAQVFKDLAGNIIEAAEKLQHSHNKGVLIFIAGGMIDFAEAMTDYIQSEVQKN